MSTQIDRIDFELFKSALFAAADEMAVTVCRTTCSGVLRDNMDFSTSITDSRGEVVAQGLALPMHHGSVRTALEAVLARYECSAREFRGLRNRSSGTIPSSVGGAAFTASTMRSIAPRSGERPHTGSARDASPVTR